MKRLIFCLSVFSLLFSILLVMPGCKKEPEWVTDPTAMLEFSTDTIMFDTVFTTVGSVTANLRVYNRYEGKIRINEITLAGGTASTYEINIDGEPAIHLKDVEIDPGDSIFIFVRVTVNPNNAGNPFVLEDSLVFNTNGHHQAVKLIAWGQNARYIIANRFIEGLPPFSIVAGENETVVWNNELPYLVYGYAVVDSTALLRIEEGTRIHFHSQSGLWIYKGGCLKVNGTVDNPVIFQGDKLGYEYEEVPGQWDRIWINEGSVDNEINYAVIKNGFIGIQAETLQEYMDNQLTLTNTIIKNMTGAGIFTRFYVISGYNNVVGNCGQYTMALTMGGFYEFAHCTLANLWNESYRPTQSVALTNYILDKNQVPVVFPFSSWFGNSMIYGNLNDEFMADFEEGEAYSWKFMNSLLKTTQNTSDTSHFIDCLVNENPIFRDPAMNDYHLDTIISPVIGKGSPTIASNVPFDLDGVARTGNPDLGAYQFVSDTNANEGKKNWHKTAVHKVKTNKTAGKTVLHPAFGRKIQLLGQ